MKGELLFEGGSGTKRASMGDALAPRVVTAGEAVTERGRGTAMAGNGDGGSSFTGNVLRGVECDRDEDGEGVLVRVREGVRVLRERGLLNDTFRSLSNGEG